MTQAGLIVSVSAPLVIRGEVLEGEAWQIMARPESRVKAPVLAANVSAVDITVTDADGSLLHHVTPTVASVVLAALAVTADWTADPIGYSVLYQLDPADFGGAVGGRKYLVEIILTTVASATLVGPRVIQAYIDVRGTVA